MKPRHVRTFKRHDPGEAEQIATLYARLWDAHQLLLSYAKYETETRRQKIEAALRKESAA